MKNITLVALLLCFALTADAQQSDSAVALPKPKTEGGKPLLTVLRERKSERSFSSDTLSLQTVSNLLWAAFGINRPGENKRTAPSAHNWQEVDLYCVMANGAFRYDAQSNALALITPSDVRSLTGMQTFVGTAPLTIVYVANLAKMGTISADEKLTFASVSAGCIVENAYLFCASEGLSAVVRGMIPREKLAPLLKLQPDQKIIVAQTIGYPEKK